MHPMKRFVGLIDEGVLLVVFHEAINLDLKVLYWLRRLQRCFNSLPFWTLFLSTSNSIQTLMPAVGKDPSGRVMSGDLLRLPTFVGLVPPSEDLQAAHSSAKYPPQNPLFNKLKHRGPLHILYYGGRLLKPLVAVKLEVATMGIAPREHADRVATEVDHVLAVIGDVAPEPDVRAEPVPVASKKYWECSTSQKRFRFAGPPSVCCPTPSDVPLRP